ncbi:MAG: DNA-processing protein DprA [Actinomycetales bacterium]|nr:DNA-processing protein DprA [Actinomycetales bacterium]
MSGAVIDERLALIWMAHAAEPADRRVGALVREHGAVEAVARIQAGRSGLADEPGLRARLAHVDPRRALEQAAGLGARIVHRDGKEWPTQLDQLGDAAPFALWVLGAADLRLTMLRSIAVVGARASTSYGEAVARDWASAFASQSWTVVSGGALGIDGAVHRGALASGGMTICVLAGGVDVAYPRAHEQLLHRIADDGLLVSESPLGECVRRRRFLTRNRLIAALTRATVVIEAALRSGTTSTANAAVALNRPVLAVPGPVTSPMSAGCHALIRESGALLASAPSDVLELLEPLGSTMEARSRAPSRPHDALTEQQARVLDALPARGSSSTAELVRVAGMAVPEVTAALAILAARGLARPAGRGWEIVGRA